MRLVQNALVKAKPSWKENGRTKTLLRALRIDFHHPELTDGVVPDGVMRFINDRERKVWGQIKLHVGSLMRNADRSQVNVKVTLGYLVRESQEQSLRDTLTRWSNGDLPKLVMPVSPAIAGTMCICIDENEECFFWSAAQGRALLEETLPESARVFRTSGRVLKPTATDMAGILNHQDVVPDRFSIMEKDND